MIEHLHTIICAEIMHSIINDIHFSEWHGKFRNVKTFKYSTFLVLISLMNGQSVKFLNRVAKRLFEKRPCEFIYPLQQPF